MSNRHFPYVRALVTGASSGIGEALCYRLDKAGVEHITLVARREDRLEQLASQLGCQTSIVSADLCKPGELENVLAAVEDIDLLVNNAGFGSFGTFHTLSIEREIDMIHLNCQVPLQLASRALQGMVERNHGCIVNISSGTAFQPMPYMSTYAATKSFLLHWSEGIREELRGTRVRVIAICPGTIDTEFAAASAVPLHEIPAASLVTGSMNGLIHAIMRAITSNQGVAVPGMGNFLGSLSGRLVPRALVRRLIGAVMGSTARKISG